MANKAEQTLPLFKNMTISVFKKTMKKESTCLDFVACSYQMPGKEFPGWYQNSSLGVTSVGSDRVIRDM